MRLINADDLMEHVWRDKLDSRELIAKMVDNAPTVKEIPTNIPINVFEQLISQGPKTGRWIKFVVNGQHKIRCDKCDYIEPEYVTHIRNYCPNCGAKMVESEE